MWQISLVAGKLLEKPINDFATAANHPKNCLDYQKKVEVVGEDTCQAHGAPKEA